MLFPGPACSIISEMFKHLILFVKIELQNHWNGEACGCSESMEGSVEEHVDVFENVRNLKKRKTTF